MINKKPQYPHGIRFQHFHNTDIHPETANSLDYSSLERLINKLQEYYYILPAQEWREKALQERLEPLEICLTFDDGLLCQYEVALPLLEAHGLTAFWFVPSAPLKGEWLSDEIYRYFKRSYTPEDKAFYALFRDTLAQLPEAVDIQNTLADFVPSKDKYAPTLEEQKFSFLKTEVLSPEKFSSLMEQLLKQERVDKAALAEKCWMNSNHLKRLQQTGHIVGLHSHSHPRQLKSLPKAKQLKEYRQNQSILSDILGKRPLCMSHPHNSYNENTLDVLQTLDVKLGFSNNQTQHPSNYLEQARVPQSFWMDN